MIIGSVEALRDRRQPQLSPQTAQINRGLRHMADNCVRDLPWFTGGPPHGGHFVIVGGAPSILTRMDSIETRQRAGATVVALNGANACLRAHGITPDLVVFVDPSEGVAGFVTDAPNLYADNEPSPYDRSLYLVASICHPSVFDALEGREVWMWHPDMPEPHLSEIKRILALYPDRPASTIGGGNTGALRAMNLGFVLGYRAFHMYGVDSSYPPGGADHAYVKHDGVEPEPMIVMHEGKSYCCSPWMVKQAEDFKFAFAQLTALGCQIFVHGEGLIPAIARNLKKKMREYAGVGSQVAH